MILTILFPLTEFFWEKVKLIFRGTEVDNLGKVHLVI